MNVIKTGAAVVLEHGDPRCYRRGCRCTKCRAGANRSNIKNRYLRQTGRGIMRPASRAADHLLLLRAAGLDDKTIRQQTGICPDVMYRILRRDGVIHARTEIRITRVSVPLAPGASSNRAYIPGHGTVRRLRALVAAGWYQAELARRLGKQKENLKQIIDRGEDGQVAQYVADEVRALYRELHNQKPEDHGVNPRFADRARKVAADRGWTHPDYWDEDDLDNVDFTPVTKIDFKRNEIAALRREEIIHLAWCGHEPEQILARLDNEVSISTIRQIVAEWRSGEKRQRKQVAA